MDLFQTGIKTATTTKILWDAKMLGLDANSYRTITGMIDFKSLADDIDIILNDKVIDTYIRMVSSRVSITKVIPINSIDNRDTIHNRVSKYLD